MKVHRTSHVDTIYIIIDTFLILMLPYASIHTPSSFNNNKMIIHHHHVHPPPYDTPYPAPHYFFTPQCSIKTQDSIGLSSSSTKSPRSSTLGEFLGGGVISL